MAQEREVWSVSRLNREAKLLLETGLPALWVEGELSNLARPGSGHWYFSLKDATAQVRCAMFRQNNRKVRFSPAPGLQVLVRARVSIYEARGDFQLIADHMEEAGHGALQRAFEALKSKLAAEGLFDEALKRQLPFLPRRIGVVTSPTGAAIRDVLSVLRRRFPAVPVVVYPVPVQGEGAGQKIADAITLAGERGECDVLILTRGGGSIEDLWAFNEEVVARALRDCPIPSICGVGHEIDFTIADFAADRRAPTPSAAAEMAVPNRDDLLLRLTRVTRSMRRAWVQAIEEYRGHMRWLIARLVPLHPGRHLQAQAQRLDDLEQRLMRVLHDRSAAARSRLPALEQRLVNAWRHAHERAGMRTAGVVRALHTVSPLATLARGYAIVTPAGSDTPVLDPGELETGDRIRTRLHRGELVSIVKEVKR